MKDNDIKRVIDESLSNTRMTEQSMDGVMRRIQEAQELPPHRPRKLTVAIAIVLVLLLVSTAALAEISLLDVFERSFEIEKEEDCAFIDDWSLEHQMELIDLLSNAGEDLNAEKTALLYSNELSEEEKSDLAVEILEECYDLKGGYIDTVSILWQEKGPIENWTHEERAWLSEQQDITFERSGDMRYLVPTDHDLSEEDAYAIAYQYYEKTLGLGIECFDTTRQLASFGEILGEEDAIIKIWHLSLTLNIDQYDGKELAWDGLTINISNDGEVTYAGELDLRTWRDDWYDTLMSENFWTIEGLYAFKEEWSSRAEQLKCEGAELSSDIRYLLSKPYGMPTEGDLSLEEARTIAKNTLLNLPRWDEEMLIYYGTREAYYIGDPNQYCIVYTIFESPQESEFEVLDLNIDGEIPISVRICIDSETGEIVEIYQNDSDWDLPDRLGI